MMLAPTQPSIIGVSTLPAAVALVPNTACAKSGMIRRAAEHRPAREQPLADGDGKEPVLEERQRQYRVGRAALDPQQHDE